MILNKIRETSGRVSIRDIVDRFEDEKLSLTALQMKTDDGYKKYSYGEMRNEIRALSNALIRMGIKKGEPIGIISENRPEWVLTYIAVTYIGAVIAPFDTLLKQNELSEIISTSGVKLIFSSSIHLEKVVLSETKSPRLKQIILFDYDTALHGEYDTENFMDSKFINFYSLVSFGKKLISEGYLYYKKTEVLPQDLAALLFTSGTTEQPKGVMLSHNNLISNADGLNMATVLGPGDNWIIVLPYHHAYPTILGVILPILTYATITTVPTLRPNILIQTMRETGATCIPAVPLLIEKIYKSIFTGAREKGLTVYMIFKILFGISRFFYKIFHVKIGPFLFKSVREQLGVVNLKFFISGGGPISKKIIDGMETLGLTLMQGYGLTECSPVVSSTVPEHNRAGTVGLPICNVEVKIASPDRNGDGELLTRGPHLMLGYFNNPEMTSAVIDSDGYFHTGDIARMDKNGFITIHGRVKNIIVTKGGKNIYPEEIENHLLESQYISEVVVVPKSEGKSGEYPYAYIYPNFDAITMLEKELQKKLENSDVRDLIGREIKEKTSTIADYKKVRGFEILANELPMTSASKVKRYMFKGR